MITEQTIRNRYFELLQAHVARPAEEHLAAISELGRALVLADIPPEDIGEMHEQAILRLAQEYPHLTLLEAALSTSAAMTEMLMAYGLAFRARNEQLQREIAEHERAEAALRESEEHHRLLFQNAPVGILSADATGHILTVNPAILRMLGSPSAEATREINILTFPLLVEVGFAADFRRCLEEGIAIVSERLYTSKWGKETYFKCHLTPIREVNGQTIGLQTIIEDITESKQAEESLQRKTHQQEQLLETTRHLTESLDVEEVLTRIGMGAKEILEAYGCAIYLLGPGGRTLTPVVAIEPPHEEVILSTPLDVETSLTGQAVKTRQALVFNDISGSEYGQQIPGTPVEEDERVIVAPFVVDDEVLGAMCLSRLGRIFSEEDLALAETFATYAVTALRNARTHDELQREVKERNEAEEELRENEELLRATLESTADGILVVDEGGKMVHANTRFAEMWRIPQSVLRSRDNDTLLDFALLDQLQDPGAFLTRVRYLYRSSKDDLDTLQFKDGRVFEQFSRPLLQDGMVAGRVWSFRDITERVHAEKAQRRRAEELSALQATVLEITASHDLPTLLQTIVERAAQLLDAPVGGLYLCDPDQQEVRCVVSYNTPHDYTGTVLKYGEGAAGTMAQTGEPLIIDDYRTWSGRAAVYEEEQPFTSVLSAPMIWQGQVTGVIHVLHNEEEGRRFTQADLELLTLFANHAAIAVENARLYEKALRDAKTKATLLDEVNHRVKNTLVAIIGLLHVEQSYAEMTNQATYETIIQNLTNRVGGLATVHSLLSASEWEPLPLSDLAGQVIKSATQMYPRDKQVFIDAPPSPVRVTADQAHNLAIVINELATNTIQHTLPGRNTVHISVRIALENNDVILFEYRDDGPGYPEDVLRLERHAVGFDLIQNLARQSLQGELSLHNDGGAMAVIRFPAQT